MDSMTEAFKGDLVDKLADKEDAGNGETGRDIESVPACSDASFAAGVPGLVGVAASNSLGFVFSLALGS